MCLTSCLFKMFGDLTTCDYSLIVATCDEASLVFLTL